MDDLRRLLKAGDPVAHEGPLSAVEIQRMLRTVVAIPPAEPRWWPQPVLVAATVVLAIAGGVGLGRQLHVPPQNGAPSGGAGVVKSAASEAVTRQLQFEIPGGTRIIWVFDPDFKL